MRSIISSVFVMAVVGIAFVAASPYPLDYDVESVEGDLDLVPAPTVENQDVASYPEEVDHVRAKRATCDLLSPFKVGHAACALHCISLGRRGGWCDGRAVCNCRN